MSGKKRNVSISREQLEKALERQGKSKNDLYRYLESTGEISDRHARRCVADERMSIPVIELCARFLECSTDYLTGKSLKIKDELVRCADCIYFQSSNQYLGFCIRHRIDLKHGRGFCSWGRSKTSHTA